MSGNNKTKPFACSYHHDGCEWGVTIHAYNFEDAEARRKKLGYLRLVGEFIATVPAKAGPLVKAVCWLRNLFS